MNALLAPARLLCVLTVVGLPGLRAAAADAPDWALAEHAYRLVVTVDPGPTPRTNAPVGVAIDFDRLFREHKLEGDLDRNSIRVVEYDPAARRSVPVDPARDTFERPHCLTGDFFNDRAGHVWWRIRDARATHYHVYFDSLAHGRKPPAARIGPIGVGEPLYYNHGRPGPAPVRPLHSQYWHVDWDGDGLRDLIGFAYRRYEHGAPLEPNQGNGVYFLKNVGAAGKPLFAPRERLKGADGKYLQTDLLPQNMTPVDWNADGHVDFVGADSRKQLLHWANTGRRDRNGCYLLEPPRAVAALTAVSEFREHAPGVVRKPGYSLRALSVVDWRGDGGRDLVACWSSTNILAKVDSRKGVIPYGAPLMIFELFEEVSADAAGGPQYAPPRVLMEERGLPLNAACYATGGVAYVDWDGDGDLDLLFHDGTNRPLEGGRLMLSENFGTRSEPAFLMPLPILTIYDSPQLVDWTGDGVVDLIAGGELFENVNPHSGGSPEQPVRGKTPGGSRVPRAASYPRFVSRGPALQTAPEMLGHWAATADWNGDGALDLVRGVESHVLWFANQGSTLEPVFAPGERLSAGGRTLRLPNWLDPQADPPHDRGPQGLGEARHSWLNPTVFDFDRDGDLDLFVTSQRWQTHYLENLGTRTAPRLAREREVRFQGDPQEFSWRSKVSLGDLDGDGGPEMVVTSDDDNTFYAYRPAAAQPDATWLEFETREPLRLEDGTPVTGWYGGQNNNGDNHSLLVDWDADGDLDLVNGTLWTVYYYENVGTPRAPRFRAHGKLKIGDEELRVFRHAGSVDVADWNGDGRLDLLVSTENPSDQPLGEIVHLFDRAVLDGDLPRATLGGLEHRPAR